MLDGAPSRASERRAQVDVNRFGLVEDLAAAVAQREEPRSAQVHVSSMVALELRPAPVAVIAVDLDDDTVPTAYTWEKTSCSLPNSSHRMIVLRATPVCSSCRCVTRPDCRA